jgi:hypothetical protein
MTLRCFGCKYCKVTGLLRAAEWIPNEVAKTVVREAFCAVGQTKTVEDSFHSARVEENKAPNNKASFMRQWHALVEKKLLSEVHKYSEIDFRGCAVPRGVKDDLLLGLFVPSFCEFPRELRAISGFGKTPRYSPHAAMRVLQYVHVELLLQCHKRNEWDLGKNSWLSVLCSCPNLLVSNVREHGGRSFFCLGMVAGVCGLGWPAKKQCVGGTTFWKPDLAATPADISFLYILDLRDSMGVAYEWTGILGQAILVVGDLQQGMLARELHEPKPLLQTCALQAFHTLPKTALAGLCKHLKCPYNGTDNLCSLLTKLVRFIFPIPAIKTWCAFWRNV